MEFFRMRHSSLRKFSFGFSAQFINFLLLFWEYCWFWFASNRAVWDATWQSFTLSCKYVMSCGCECNFSWRGSKLRLNPSARSLVLQSKSLYCSSILVSNSVWTWAVTETFRSFLSLKLSISSNHIISPTLSFLTWIFFYFRQTLLNSHNEIWVIPWGLIATACPPFIGVFLSDTT